MFPPQDSEHPVVSLRLHSSLAITELINKQQITINKIVTFIKKNNYFGEDYHNYKDIQENAHEFWKKYFYNETIAKKDILSNRLEYVSSELKLFIKSLL